MTKKSLQNLNVELIIINNNPSERKLLVNGEEAAICTLNENGTAIVNKTSELGVVAFEYTHKIKNMALSTWVQVQMNNFYDKKEESIGIEIGRKVYFEDENGAGYGKVHYLPNEQEVSFFKKLHGESAVSIMPNRSNRARFIPISQIILK